MAESGGLMFGPAEIKEIAERFSNMDDTDLTDNMLKMRATIKNGISRPLSLLSGIYSNIHSSLNHKW